ncbi:MAG: FHA domain-containing protein [Chloroflexi bacterium]|nr:FHA domain-containing protein [Chloroflexota bacterium]
MLCPMCNEMNKMDARYCEYCGTKLEPATAGVAATSVSQSQPVVVSALTCSRCGAVVLLDESSCDICGHVLKQYTGHSGAMPTIPPPSAPVPTSVSGEIRIPDLPSGGFVGASSNMNDIHQGGTAASVGIKYEITDEVVDDTADASAKDDVPVVDGDVVAEESTHVVAEHPHDDTRVDQAASWQPVDAPVAPEAPEAPEEPEAPVDVYADRRGDAGGIDEPADRIDAVEPVADESAAVISTVPSAGIDVQAIRQKRQVLEDEIKRQKDIIQQLNQMRNAFREVTPQAVLMGIEEAEHKLRDAQAEFDALPTPPEIDPQVIERLRKDHMRQLEIIDQFEQLQRTFGLATPRAVIQGIVEARDTEDRLRKELVALGVQVTPQSGTSAPIASPEIPVPPPVPTIVPPTAMPTNDAVRVRDANAPVEIPQNVLPEAPRDALIAAAPSSPVSLGGPVGPVMNPAAPPARLQLESGTTLQLPAGRREIIIGRSDPISAVHPEIDLTPYGAESGGVSRRHVRLTVIDGQWMITDLQSTNYTRVNGVRIDPGVPTQLPDGAQVVLGRIGFIFRSA